MNPVICCIGYNRPNSIKRLLDSLGNAVYDDNNITLVISIDESPESDMVEAVAKRFMWNYGEKKILRYPKRLGLKEHCLRCGDLSQKYGAVIFLEDDVVVAPGFYRFVKQTIAFYEKEDRIMGISLYKEKWVADLSLDFIPAYNGQDVFFTQRELSHGQCWLKQSWQDFRNWYNCHKDLPLDYNKKIPPCVYKWKSETSWSKFISYYMVEKNKYYVCPYHSFATNMSEVGTHARKTTDVCQVPLSEKGPIPNRFARYEDAIKYDAFYERIDNYLNDIDNIPFTDICSDLNGQKYDWSGYKYLLSVKELPYRIVKEFGVNMEPIENNVAFSVQGEGIFLYEIPQCYSAPKTVDEKLALGLGNARLSHIYNKVPLRILYANIKGRVIESFKEYIIRALRKIKKHIGI